jgi:hypothetical protein
MAYQSIETKTKCSWTLTGPLYTTPTARHPLPSHITIALTQGHSHRPILQRDPPPERRTLRPDKGSATATALPLLFPRLSRYLPGFPTSARTTRSCCCCGTPFDSPNQGLYAPDPRSRARTATSYTCNPLCGESEALQPFVTYATFLRLIWDTHHVCT